ncbi:MAG: hypothetical protein IJG60_00160 [Thermoguttaceae bacterium]|nr:hypothetical protein [Thermoguttaceae bacterium]
MDKTILFPVFFLLFLFVSFFLSAEENTPNRFSGTDSQRIAAAIAEAPRFGGVVKIPPRVPDQAANRGFWLIDSAIIVPGNTTVIFENCKIKLSDRARDNFIRSANCGLGIGKAEPLENIHLIGVGDVVFEGADRPRSTGDGKPLYSPFAEGEFPPNSSFGTDCDAEEQRHNGDWRNIGILLARVSRFSIRNITVREPHAWSVSLERCAHGTVRDLMFEASENREIDGHAVKTRNQDGLNLRKGCHHILIENISGRTGDDVVALTALDTKPCPAGTFDRFEISGTEPDDDNGIRDVILRNVAGYAAGGHQIVRLLNSPETRLSNILIDGVLDTSPEEVTDKAAVLIGDVGYGGPAPAENTDGLIVRNVISKAQIGVWLRQPVRNSLIDGVINQNPNGTALKMDPEPEQSENLLIRDIIE